MKGCRVPFQMWKLYENRSSFKSTVLSTSTPSSNSTIIIIKSPPHTHPKKNFWPFAKRGGGWCPNCLALLPPSIKVMVVLAVLILISIAIIASVRTGGGVMLIRSPAPPSPPSPKGGRQVFAELMGCGSTTQSSPFSFWFMPDVVKCHPIHINENLFKFAITVHFFWQPFKDRPSFNSLCKILIKLLIMSTRDNRAQGRRGTRVASLSSTTSTMMESCDDEWWCIII